MAFHEREFDTYALLGDPRLPELWSWPRWQEVVDVLTPLVGAARGRAAVRVDQIELDRKTHVRFGRIGWNAAGHEKWVHGSPRTRESSRGWLFESAEMWAPSWSECARDGLAPELFFAIRNEASWNPADEVLKFNPVVLLAVACNLGPEVGAAARAGAERLAGHLSAVLAVHQRRAWGKPFGTGFSDAIQDLISVGLFALGPAHRRAVDETTLVESWSRLG